MELAYLQFRPEKKQVLVLLHGFCEDKSLWEDFAEHLSPDYRVICPDLLGFGESAFVPRQNIETMAESLNELLEKLNIAQVCVIGHSLGAYVALAFAEKYAKKLTGIGLFHSTAFADSDEKKQNRQKAIQHIENYGKSAYLTSFFPNLFTLKNREIFTPQIHKMEQNAQKISTEAIIATLQAMKNRPDRTHILENLEVPVLFIVGKQDASVSLSDSLKQCAIPSHSVVHFLENVGHLGIFEAKSTCIKIINNFLSLC